VTERVETPFRKFFLRRTLPGKAFRNLFFLGSVQLTLASDRILGHSMHSGTFFLSCVCVCVCVYATKNFWIDGWIFMKFGRQVMPLKMTLTPHSFNLVALTIPKWRTFKFLRWVQRNSLITWTDWWSWIKSRMEVMTLKMTSTPYYSMP
jgi:hypothetical protein